MDEQEKEIEEILRTFDKAPSPSSENSVQNQAQQNNKQPRQISQKPTDTERIARTSNQTEYKRQAQSSKGRYLSPTRKTAIKPVSETAPIKVDFERLQEENKDIIAWLYCPDTEINYPVVQSKDNEYYLRRLLDGTWNIAGTLFMDYRNAADCSDLHTIIYGHNMKNNTMFGSLPKYSKQEYYEEHSVCICSHQSRIIK